MNHQLLEDGAHPVQAALSKTPHGGARSGWARIFGYDIFISFALGSPPRGCRAYASDLARQLRERGFTVFFSEDEAPVGAELDGTLRRALRRSRILVVIANRGTLADPRWVRTEVQEYRLRRPHAAVVPINVDGALQDPTLTQATETWLPFVGRIWIDETEHGCLSGRVSENALERLVTAPHAVRSLVRLRIVIGLSLTGFALLAAFALVQRHAAVGERDRAQQALLASSARQALLLSRDGRAQEGWDVLVEALAQARPQVDGPLPEGFLEAALTTLVENRSGPELAFDAHAVAPAAREEGDTWPPPFAFDARGGQVAVAAGKQLAVWSTADGRRVTQVLLPLQAERLTFTADGTMLVAEGPEPAPAKNPETRGAQRAVAVNIVSGSVKVLPLMLCEQWIPCVSGGVTVTQLLPLAKLPAHVLPSGKAFVASAAGEMRVHGTSGSQFILLSHRPPEADRKWLLLDRSSGLALPLDVSLGAQAGERASSASDYGLAREAPVLVASGNNDSGMVVYRIEAGLAGPRLVQPRPLEARQAGATQGVQLDDQGKTLRYQNYRYGTGTGVGIGRTVVLDVQSGREVWARGEGEVAWGSNLVALQEDWADTQLLSADTGATWFVAPGRPLGFDPTGRMLLMWDKGREGDKNKASPWPRLRLLETLPVRQFARDPRGPASARSACMPPSELRFLTLAERPDRLWNREDWHQWREPPDKKKVRAVDVSASAATPVVAASAVATATGSSGQWVRLLAHGKRWRLASDDEASKTVELDRNQIESRYPWLAGVLRAGESLEALLSSSDDSRWHAVVTPVDDAGRLRDPACKGWVKWRLHHGQDPKPVRSGCTTGELAGPGQIPGVQFLNVQGGAGAAMLVAVPTDTCKYELLDLESRQSHGAVVPAFGNDVTIERLTPDLLAVRSSDWYGATWAYQLQALGSDKPGPVFILADRNRGEEEDKGASERQSTLWPPRLLYEPAPASADREIETSLAFDPGGRVLRISSDGRTTVIGAPPWGERLRERLRQAVQVTRAASSKGV